MQYSLCCIETYFESVATVGSAFAGLNAMSSLCVFLPSYFIYISAFSRQIAAGCVLISLVADVLTVFPHSSILCLWQLQPMLLKSIQADCKVAEKNLRVFQSRTLAFLQVVTTKSKCNGKLHRGSFRINSSNITGHHHTVTMSQIHETLSFEAQYLGWKNPKC